ncbi:MAG: YheC/YheD family protein [Candidatus Gracilibacteria bacterium]
MEKNHVNSTKNKQPILAILIRKIKPKEPLSSCSVMPAALQILKKIPQFGMQGFLVLPQDAPLKRKDKNWYGRIQISTQKWKRIKIEKPAVVYDKTILRNSRFAPQAIPMRNFFDQEKIPRFQARDFTGFTQNKRNFFTLLSKNKSLKKYLPDTISLNEPADKIQLFFKKHSAFILKPTMGGKGKGIIHLYPKNNQWHYRYSIGNQKFTGILTSGSATSLRRLTQTLPYEYKSYILQQKIDGLKFQNRVFDLRMVFQRKTIQSNLKLVGMTARIGKRGSVASNISSGGKAMKVSAFLKGLFPNERTAPKKILEEIHTLGTLICDYIGEKFKIHEFAIDLMIDTNKKIWLIEANSQPAAYSIFTLAGSHKEANQIIKNACTYARSLV